VLCTSSKGETQNELLKVLLGWTRTDRPENPLDEHEFAMKLRALHSYPGFRCVTKLFLMNCRSNFSQSFRDNARTLFKVRCERLALPISDTDCEKAVNEWISEQTNGEVENVF
jgi:hypothetical protein